jgi:hypothetical protein
VLPFVTRLSTARLLDTKVAKLCAALLVVLCIVPTTAPFSTLGSTDFLFGRSVDAMIGTLATHTSLTDTDDNDALVLERLHFLRQPILYALVVTASGDAAATVPTAFFPFAGPPAFTIDSPPLKAILRL